MSTRSEIRKARIAIQMEMTAEDQRHERKMKKLEQKMIELRKTCSHPEATFHGDPAGGSDSCHECEDCRKTY